MALATSYPYTWTHIGWNLRASITDKMAKFVCCAILFKKICPNCKPVNMSCSYHYVQMPPLLSAMPGGGRFLPLISRAFSSLLSAGTIHKVAFVYPPLDFRRRQRHLLPRYALGEGCRALHTLLCNTSWDFFTVLTGVRIHWYLLLDPR